MASLSHVIRVFSLTIWYLSSGVNAISARLYHVSVRGLTPQFPYHPDTTEFCTWWWDNDGLIACEDMPDAWFIDREDFLRWVSRVTME